MKLTIADLCCYLPGLTAAPAGVLLALHEANGRYLSEAAIFAAVENVTGNRDTTHAANSAIKFARRALRQHGAGTIECRALVGWRLIWNSEWRAQMIDNTALETASLNVTATIARADEQIILIVEQSGRSTSTLRMTRGQAIEMAQKLIHTAK